MQFKLLGNINDIQNSYLRICQYLRLNSYREKINMKSLIFLCLVALASAKPRINPSIKFANGKIIGGQEAPKRKYFYFKLQYAN